MNCIETRQWQPILNEPVTRGKPLRQETACLKWPKAWKGESPIAFFIYPSSRNWTPALSRTVQLWALCSRGWDKDYQYEEGFSFSRLYACVSPALHVQYNHTIYSTICIKIIPIIKGATCSLTKIFENTGVAERIKHPETYHLKTNCILEFLSNHLLIFHIHFPCYD